MDLDNGVRGLVFITCICVSHISNFEASASIPEELPVRMEIGWERGDDLAWEYNGGAMGVYDDKIAYATGFGRNVPDELLNTPGYFDGYHRLLAVYNKNTRVWAQETPLFPGIARAYTTTPIDGGVHGVFVLGGQSYASPHIFSDAYRLNSINNQWEWQQLPDMLQSRSMFGGTIIDGFLYVQGGVHYDQADGWDTTIANVGKSFERLDLSNLEQGWQSLSEMPGTTRSHQAVVNVGGKIYVMGGVLQKGGNNPQAWNMIDNWVYDPQAQTWSQLSDQPYAAESWSALVLEDRYVAMFGGFGGREVIDPQGQVITPISDDIGFIDRVLVYDTVRDEYFAGTPMPREMADTRVVWLEEESVFLALTAEIDDSQRIPDAYIGRIVLIPEPGTATVLIGVGLVFAMNRKRFYSCHRQPINR